MSNDVCPPSLLLIDHILSKLLTVSTPSFHIVSASLFLFTLSTRTAYWIRPQIPGFWDRKSIMFFTNVRCWVLSLALIWTASFQFCLRCVFHNNEPRWYGTQFHRGHCHRVSIYSSFSRVSSGLSMSLAPMLGMFKASCTTIRNLTH
jgi:hypothetical protein